MGSPWLDFPAEVIEDIAAYLLSPDKRLFLGYLCSSALLAFWVFCRGGQGESFRRYLFNQRIWWGRSAKLDYQLVAFNSVLRVLLAGQFTLYGLHIAFWTEELLRRALGPCLFTMSEAITVLTYSAVFTVLGDLSVYLVHRLMHSIPWLWTIHSVHHSAETLSPVTLLRVHPVELVINTLRSVLVFGLLAGLFGYLSRHQVTVFTLLGVNVATFLFFAFGANLRHSHVPLAYWPAFERILISPRQHQLHHSTAPEHHHRNYGSKFALWDWMFCTLAISSQAPCALRFGLGDATIAHDSLWTALSRPLGLGPSRERETD